MRKAVVFGLLFLLLANSFAVSAQESVKEKKSAFSRVEAWYEEHMNYATVTLLMAVESSFIPFPSEIVIPPAAYVASKPESRITVPGVVLFGTIGSLLGALINYLLAVTLGRVVIYRFADGKIGHLLMLSGEKVKRAEDFFNKYGVVSTFIGRLVPVVRQLISIPAGLARMKIWPFAFFTVLGAGIWNVVLAFAGYLAQGQQDLMNEYMHRYTNELMFLLGFVILLAIVLYYFKNKKKKAVENK